MKLYYPKDHYDSSFRGHVFPLLKPFIKPDGFSDKERISIYGVSEQDFKFVNQPAEADIVILLDVTQKESFSRSPRNEKGKIMKRDEFEKNEQFSRKISKLYRTTAKKKHWKIIDASKTKSEIHEEIVKAFSKKLGI